MRIAIRHFPLVTASALGLMLASSSAFAQDNTENVTVYAPHIQYGEPGERDLLTGAPYGTVKMSEAVSYNDLDLRTPSGAQSLEERVRIAAQDVCARLDRMYPIGDPDGPPCIEGALKTGMERADAAIERVRYYAALEPGHHYRRHHEA